MKFATVILALFAQALIALAFVFGTFANEYNMTFCVGLTIWVAVSIAGPIAFLCLRSQDLQ